MNQRVPSLILTLILIIADTLLAWFSVRFSPAGAAGVSSFIIAVAFVILFVLVWCLWCHCRVCRDLAGSGFFASDRLVLHPEVAIIRAIAGLISVLIPLVTFRTLKVDLSLVKRRDWILFFLFAVLINNIIGAAWGALTLSLGNIIKTGEISGIFSTLVIGSFIVTILIIPLALSYFTPKIRGSKLFVTYYWE